MLEVTTVVGGVVVSVVVGGDGDVVDVLGGWEVVVSCTVSA